MNALPRRRWFRFGLRSMFALLTFGCIAAAWTAYHLHWIQKRHDKLRDLRTVVIDYSASLNPDRCNAPGALALFGEEGHSEFGVCEHSISNQERENLARLFPESRVEVIPRNFFQIMWSLVPDSRYSMP